jgi:hypothetical protein
MIMAIALIRTSDVYRAPMEATDRTSDLDGTREAMHAVGKPL